MCNRFITLLTLFFFLGFLDASAQSKFTKIRKYGYTPALLRGPYLQVPTANSIIVRWRTDENDVSFVRYGKNPDHLDKVAGNSYRTKEHLVTLNGLEPFTKYYYLIEGVRDTLQWDVNNYFYTQPAPGAKGKVIVGLFGDCGNNSDNQRKVRDAFETYTKNMILNAWIPLGDNAYSFGKDSEFQTNFFDIYKDGLLKTTPVLPIPGNHDFHDEIVVSDHAQESGTVAYYASFTMPTKAEMGGVPSNTQSFYSFDIGNVHFIALDSYGLENYATTRVFDTSGRQVKWLKEDLEANKNKDWTIVLIHHPPHSMGSHSSDTESQLIKIRERLMPILERYGVDVVFSGHSHSYERSKLMKGFYGKNAEFDEKYLLSKSSGKNDGSVNSQPYVKNKNNQGTVYVVSGSAGALDHVQKTYPHNALPYSDATLGGASLLTADGNKLLVEWIRSDGKVADAFTIIKNKN